MSNGPETEPLSWWEVDSEIQRKVDKYLPPEIRPGRLVTGAKYEELARPILAEYLRSGRDVSGLLADMVEQRVLELNFGRSY